nr:glycosyltransferase [Streptomyces sp. DSM 41633]
LLCCGASSAGTAVAVIAQARKVIERPESTMKFVLASYGTRGDIEPLVAVGRELLGRGHDVRMAVPPDLVSFAEAAGPTAIPYGPDLQAVLDSHRDFWTHFFRNFWKVRELIRLRREVVEPFHQCWKDI